MNTKGEEIKIDKVQIKDIKQKTCNNKRTKKEIETGSDRFENRNRQRRKPNPFYIRPNAYTFIYFYFLVSATRIPPLNF